MTQDTGRIVEIFSSYQGEGIYIGMKQLFIRFADCNLDCDYCDTSFSEFREYLPAALEKEVVSYLEKESFHSISITGGEPLLHAAFLKQFFPLLKNLGQTIFLETNGSLPEQLLELIDLVDIISMDFKCSADGSIPLLDKHRAFLEIASRKSCFVKIVIPPLAELHSLFASVEVIGNIDASIPLVLQPQTDQLPLSKAYFNILNTLYAFAKSELQDVRLIPQVHPFLKIP